MRILLLSYHFPPDAEVGAMRPYQFARLLPEHGIEPWVVTVRTDVIERRDDSFYIEGVPSEHIIRTPVNVTRRMQLVQIASTFKNSLNRSSDASVAENNTPAPEGAGISGEGWLRATPRRRWLLEWLRYPDAMAGWRQPALEAAEKLLREQQFDLIISTSPPRVAHLVALELANRHNLPWVMDLRDPWYKDIDEIGSPTIEAAYDRLLLPCFRRADKIVLNTGRLRDDVNERWPEFAGKTIAIPNGCNTPKKLSPAASASAQFTIGHYGSVYSKRDPGPFLRGLRAWLDGRNEADSPVRVRFIGPEFGTAPEHVEALGLSSIVSLCPPVARERALEMMQEDYVLLLMANKQPLQIPGKLYEYLAARRRILITAEADGATADLVREAKGVVLAESDDDVTRTLEAFWQQFVAGKTAEISNDALLDECSYTRRTALLADVIHSLKRPAALNA